MWGYKPGSCWPSCSAISFRRRRRSTAAAGVAARDAARSARRSARVSNSLSTVASTAVKPPSCSSRSRSARQSPPARFTKISASIICRSSQPCGPTTGTNWRIAATIPLARIRSRYSGRPLREVRPALPGSASCPARPHTGSSAHLAAAFVIPLGIVHDQQIQTISLILHGQRGTGSFLVRDCGKRRS